MTGRPVLIPVGEVVQAVPEAAFATVDAKVWIMKKVMNSGCDYGT
jgi:hypothetical protein